MDKQTTGDCSCGSTASVSRAPEQLCPDIVDYIAACRKLAHPESYLIAILHRIQQRYRYLSETRMRQVAEYLGVPAATVSGVASFYNFFRLEPCGRFKISVCLGTACYVKGAEGVARKLEEELGIKLGETSKDGLFTLETARCLGTCGLAPVLMVDDEVYANVTPEYIPTLLAKYIEKARTEPVEA